MVAEEEIGQEGGEGVFRGRPGDEVVQAAEGDVRKNFAPVLCAGTGSEGVLEKEAADLGEAGKRNGGHAEGKGGRWKGREKRGKGNET